MTIIIKSDASDEAVKEVTNLIESKGLTAHLSKGFRVTIVGAVGDETKPLDTDIEVNEDADKVVVVTESYKLVNRKPHPKDSVIPVGNIRTGPGTITVMAGPCAIESQDQLMETAYAVRKARVIFLRGSTYKPRISPYSFQRPEEEGLKCMKEARETTDFSITCKVTSAYAIESIVKYVDILQIGTRNTQNFGLPEEAGKSGTPVSLRHGLCATIDKWLNAAEYTISEGNPNIVLCEHGICTYETSTRNILDISAVPVIRQKNHLPIIVDPSHVAGVRAYVEPLAKTAIVAGADGPMIEVHPCPARVLSDGPQFLTFDAFEQLIRDLIPHAELSGRTLKVQ